MPLRADAFETFPSEATSENANVIAVSLRWKQRFPSPMQDFFLRCKEMLDSERGWLFENAEIFKGAGRSLESFPLGPPWGVLVKKFGGFGKSWGRLQQPCWRIIFIKTGYRDGSLFWQKRRRYSFLFKRVCSSTRIWSAIDWKLFNWNHQTLRSFCSFLSSLFLFLFKLSSLLISLCSFSLSWHVCNDFNMHE